MWYNVENLFHPSDDTLSSDDDFTPGGLYHWTFGRYREKITRIAKVIIATGEGEPPEVVGLGEVECDSVLEDLVSHPILEPYGYRYLHRDSPDHRGIDVACLYREKRVRLLGWCSYPPSNDRSGRHNSTNTLSDHSGLPTSWPGLDPRPGSDLGSGSVFAPGLDFGRTREILHGWWVWKKQDTVDLLLVHLISRYGGSGATQGYRQQQCEQILSILDSVSRVRPGSLMVVGGDFNDEFTGPSMKPFHDDTASALRCNIPALDANAGSYKYRGTWERIDFFMVAGPDRVHGISSRVFTLPPLMTTDETYGGMKPFRTFEGVRYTGGTSDHLPVLLEISDKIRR